MGMDIKAPELLNEVEIIQKNGIKLINVMTNNTINTLESLSFNMCLFIEYPFLLKDHLNNGNRYNN